MTEREFTELKVQLARIEENVSNLPEVKAELKEVSKVATESYHRSIDTEKRIESMENKITWVSRTLGATIISIVAGLLFKM